MIGLIDFLFTGIVWGFWIGAVLLIFFWIYRMGRKERVQEESGALNRPSLEDCGPDTSPC